MSRPGWEHRFLHTLFDPEERVDGIPTEELKRLLEERLAAESAAKAKKPAKPRRGSPKRGPG